MEPRKPVEDKASESDKLGKQLLLAEWFNSKLQQSIEEMKQTEEKLDIALAPALKLDPKMNPLNNVKKLLSPEIKPEAINEYTSLNTLDALLKETLRSQSSKDPKPTNITKAWAKVRTLFASRKESKDEEHVPHGNTREKIKPYLNSVSVITTLDPWMNAYQNARVKYLADLIAYKNAQRTLEHRNKLQAKYHDCYVDDVRLVRHEVCDNLTKMYGFNKDTGLTAVYKPLSKKQSQYDLIAIKQIRSSCARALKAIGEIKHLELHVSPIKRAYQTAVLAGYDSDIPDSTFVSRLYTETKHGKTKTFGARSSDAEHEDGALEQLVNTMDLFKERVIEPNAFSKNVVDRQEERIDAAVKNIFIQNSATSSESKGASERDVFAHGGANRDFIERFRQKLEEQHIPHNIPFGKAAKVGFGDDFILHIMRDKKNGHIVAVDFEGQFSNRGELKPHVTKAKPGAELSDADYDEMELDDYIEFEKQNKKTETPSVRFHFPGSG